MSRIRAKNTEPEVVVRSLLHRRGFRFSLHRKDLPGTPDIVLPKYRSVIFVHGCFWHSHSCRKGKTPSGNSAYWVPKLARNIERDERCKRALRGMGWRVITVWECQLRGSAKRVEHIAATLSASNRRP